MFSKNVLDDDTLKKFMNKKDFKAFINCKTNLKAMDFELADKVATAIKKWALSHGATHYTHWFFPLTSKSAEKQVSFLDIGEKGEFINKFNGNSLIKGETDASSFPSGNERMTFEARGYTIWDYSSPVFIKSDDRDNKVVYIPTAFCSFNGVALDEKTPLLRSIELLSSQATALLHKLGLCDVKSVSCQLGIEQEYFLIDEKLYQKRKDLMLCGRTLLGADPIKKQEMYHHYFGEINPKTSAFMHELDKELWSLGIMAKIQHNEVAPSQHEVVPVFSNVNISTDQNCLLMEVMNKVANRHGLRVLFHEKPFKNVNGSGKHNNWSLSTDTGLNLLDYNYVSDDVFLIVFTSILAAIDKHYDLLRMTTSCLSNDMRLGGNEAPPSVISVFIGNDMQDVLNSFAKSNTIKKHAKTILDIKTSSIAKLYKDNCDRNRTSPFAYTGNKFEFRMLGSSQSPALTNCILATIVADEFKQINERLQNCKDIKQEVNNIIKQNISNHSRIIFNGNSYDESWKIEAQNRGLVDYTNCVDCCEVLLNKDNIKLFEDNKVMTKQELNIRYITYMKTYCEGVMCEAKTLVDILTKSVIPALNNYQNDSMDLLKKLKENKLEYKNNENLFIKINKNTEKLIKLTENLKNKINYNNTDIKQLAIYCRDELLKDMEKIREIYDEMEPIIPNKYISDILPNYDMIL